MIPLERLLVETDNPGGPAWLIKKKGMPILIKDIIALLGEIKGRSSEEMEKRVQENFARLTKGLKIFPISFL
jgi:TatD DNase family protein